MSRQVLAVAEGPRDAQPRAHRAADRGGRSV